MVIDDKGFYDGLFDFGNKEVIEIRKQFYPAENIEAITGEKVVGDGEYRDTCIVPDIFIPKVCEGLIDKACETIIDFYSKELKDDGYNIDFECISVAPSDKIPGKVLHIMLAVKDCG